MLKAKELRDVKKYLKSLDQVKVSRPFSKTLQVYSVNGEPFAYLETGKQLLQLSLRSDPRLSRLLRERYEEVLPGHKLDSRKWNTIVLSGQLHYDDLAALVDHSYQLALGRD